MATPIRHLLRTGADMSEPTATWLQPPPVEERPRPPEEPAASAVTVHFSPTIEQDARLSKLKASLVWMFVSVLSHAFGIMCFLLWWLVFPLIFGVMGIGFGIIAFIVAFVYAITA